MKHFIRLKQVVCEGRKLTYRFESSLSLFNRKEFYVLYDRDFPTPSAGILAVPFASVMISLSWMTGADLEIDVLDEAYERSLTAARAYFYKWFSKKWSFAGTVRVKRTEKNAGGASRDGMLFSGGLDSLTTYIRHKDQKPLLFSFFGADIPLDQTEFVDACRQSFQEFAAHEGVELCCIESDLWTLFNHSRLRKWVTNWWGEASHGMVMSAMTAPCSYKELGRLYIASSYPAGEIFGWGSCLELDSQLRWGSTLLEHDFTNTTRFEKTQYFKNFQEYHPFLRVCLTWWKWTGEKMNCCVCEKCYRTICHLMLVGVDPANCNFAVSERTFDEIKYAIEKPHAYYSFLTTGLWFWKEIRRMAREKKALDKYGSQKFFDWLAGYDRIESVKDTPAGRMMFELRKIRWNLMSKFKP